MQGTHAEAISERLSTSLLAAALKTHTSRYAFLSCFSSFHYAYKVPVFNVNVIVVQFQKQPAS